MQIDWTFSNFRTDYQNSTDDGTFRSLIILIFVLLFVCRISPLLACAWQILINLCKVREKIMLIYLGGSSYLFF